MAYTIKAARNPQWVDSNHNMIDLEVNFEELEEEWLPYTSYSQDVCEHSRTLYTRAAAGEFGEVSTEYTVTEDDLRSIAEVKMQDLNANTIEQAAEMIRGTCVSMGIEVKG